MEDKIIKAIESLCNEIGNSTGHEQSLKYTQSALNLAHTLAILTNIKIDKEKNK